MLSEWVQSALHIFSELGYFGVALGLMIEIIPSEIVLSYAGYQVNEGNLTFWGAVVAGVIGGVLAQLFLYWAGYFGGRPLIEKYGKYIFIQSRHVEMAESWFSKYGKGVVFFARFIPVVRHAISIPAGLAKMSFATFTLYTTIAIIPWSIAFVWFGIKLGTHWDTAKEFAAPYLAYIIVGAIFCIVAYTLYKTGFRKSKRGRA
ncbi:undecaprenyl phosphate transporter UptA [Bacillus luti]